jgi:hypothetical protein
MLKELLEQAQKGELQLPDFQRSWVWNENGIKELLASVLKGFPIGSLMTLEVGGSVNFKPRPLEGIVFSPSNKDPVELILDGQQRMTSLFLSLFNDFPVKTKTDKDDDVEVFYYLDIEKIINGDDIEEAIIIMPKTKIKKEHDNIVLDLSTADKEIEAFMFPLNKSFDWMRWQSIFIGKKTAGGLNCTAEMNQINEFYKIIIEPLVSYQIPVISLDKSTSLEAVCLVFEKVNTGGKPLDAFELITAKYAAAGHNLREDWFGNQLKAGIEEELHESLVLPNQDDGILTGVSSTDFLQIVSLLSTEEKHNEALSAGKTGQFVPKVSATKKSILEMSLNDYLKYRDTVKDSFKLAASFLMEIGIYRTRDLPYQSQVTALAAIFTKIGGIYANASVKKYLEKWYWCGVFGELYRSSIETRIANDFTQVSALLLNNATDEPYTIRDANFNIERLQSMRSKLSAAYKGLTVLIAANGAKDYISGRQYNYMLFMSENVDIDHIFSKKWCKANGIKKDYYDSIINKTPISPKTNRGVVSGKAPSEFIKDIEAGNQKSGFPPVNSQDIDNNLVSHLIDPATLRKDDFYAFFNDRMEKLAILIEQKMGKRVNR